MIQKMLIKYAFNDLRSRSESCSFFDDEILHFFLDENDDLPKEKMTVLCGLTICV